jgi:hypothetical protein
MRTEAVDRELATLGARDAFILGAICVPPEQPRQPGNKLRHAFLLRLIGVRRAMKRLERRGYLEPGWSVDYLGAHCQVTELGTRVARAVAVAVSVAPGGSNPALYMRLLLNLQFAT